MLISFVLASLILGSYDQSSSPGDDDIIVDEVIRATAPPSASPRGAPPGRARGRARGRGFGPPPSRGPGFGGRPQAGPPLGSPPGAASRGFPSRKLIACCLLVVGCCWSFVADSRLLSVGWLSVVVVGCWVEDCCWLLL